MTYNYYTGLLWLADINQLHRIYQDSNIAPRLLPCFFTWSCFLLSSVVWELQDKGILENLKFWVENLGVMLHFDITEYGLLPLMTAHTQGYMKNNHFIFVWLDSPNSEVSALESGLSGLASTLAWDIVLCSWLWHFTVTGRISSRGE